MSSIFAHAAVGWACAGSGSSRGWRAAVCAVAIAPDLDYPLEWFLGIRFPERFTHSFGFCFAVAGIGFVALALFRVGDFHRRSLCLMGAAFSHILLDALVGVYPEPWLWPFSRVTYRLPFGILPSAGALTIGNPFLYRNLAIESGILLPLLFLIRACRTGPIRGKIPSIGIACLSFAAFGWLGFNLSR